MSALTHSVYDTHGLNKVIKLSILGLSSYDHTYYNIHGSVAFLFIILTRFNCCRHEDEFDTVLMATGRYALTKQLNLEAAGVSVSVLTSSSHHRIPLRDTGSTRPP